MSISVYAEELVLNKLYRNVDFIIANIYISLHTGDPGVVGSNEVGGGYIRQLADFNPASGSGVDNNGLMEFTNMPACTVTHIGTWDSQVGGSFISGGVFSSPRLVNAGDIYRISDETIRVSLS